jgi:predicted SnoaL-like aldol condensation-catalyzing enzyme
METTLKKNAARLAILSVGIGMGILFIASFASPTHLHLANAQQNKTLIQSNDVEENNKALVLKAFDTLFNQRDYVAAEGYWSPKYIQHSAHIEPGREGLFNLVKSSPPTLKYEPGTIVADGDFVIVHGRFSGMGQPVNWIAADILRIKDGVMVEHWDVIQDEATQEQSKSGHPMFGDNFPNPSENE